VNGRRLGATLLGLTAGAAGFCGLLLVGYLLYRRVWGDSVQALVVVSILFGAAGLYAAWILGMLVFSAVRGPEDGDGAAA
jgi:ABC-type Fe3+-siderophore transport system permease subunit